MVVVICCRHRAHALADSQFLCTHGKHVPLKQKKMMLSWLFHPTAPCSIQGGGSRVCGVFGHRDLTWYSIMLVEAHKKTARGVWRIIVVQYLEDWEIWASKHSERLSSDWKDRQLSEFCQKLWKASQCYSNQVLSGIDRKPGPEESSTVLVTE